MAKSKMTYAGFKTTTPPLEASFPSLDKPDEVNDKYGLKVIMNDTPECQAMIDRLLVFQNENLEKDGKPTQDTLFAVKPEMSKNEKSGEWDVPTGREFMIFHSKFQDKFAVVGANKQPINPSSVSGGDMVRVNGQAAFGYFRGDMFVTLYLNAVQLISSGGAGGVDAFDDETGGSTDAPFNDETQPTTTPSAVADLS